MSEPVAASQFFDPAAFYQAVFEHSRDAIGLSQAGLYVFVNPAYLKMFGYASYQELHGRSILDLIAPAQRAKVLEYVQQRAQGENPPAFYETQGLCKDGRIFDMEVTVSTCIFGEQLYTLVILRDISAHKLAAHQLKESEARFRILSEASPVGIFYQDPEANCLYANSKWQEITGLSFEAASGQGWLGIIHPDDLSQLWQSWREQVSQRGLFSQELRVLQPHGQIRWVSVQASAIQGFEQDVLGYVGTVEDITERKLFENQIKLSLEEREVLLREVHHRVKNNFQVVMSLLNLQLRKLNDPEAFQALQASRDRIRSMALVHQLLYESHSLTGIKVRDYLKELTRELLGLYAEYALVNIEFELDELELSLEQAIPCGLLLNELLANAFKYAFPVESAHQDALIRVSLKHEQQQVLLEVQDNGIGISEQVEIDKNTTLGLQLIQSLTRQLGGSFELQRELGTYWKIRFPTSFKVAA